MKTIIIPGGGVSGIVTANELSTMLPKYQVKI